MAVAKKNVLICP